MIGLMLAAALLQTNGRCNDLGVASRPPECPAWRALQRVGEDQMFVDPASVRRSGNMFEIGVRVIYAREQPGGVRSYISRTRLDCAARMGSVAHMTLFDAGGRQLDDWDLTGDPALPHPAPPGTPSAIMMDEFCPH